MGYRVGHRWYFWTRSWNLYKQTTFDTKLIHSIDQLLPHSQATESVTQKHPHLESILKATCIFNHAARARQFQLHIRLLMSLNPSQMSTITIAPIDVTGTLGTLVEVMAKRLHLTDSKDASPFFLSNLPAQVAEALIIKLSLYLGMSICKLLGPNNTDSALKILRIHHICRCVIGGSGPSGCNAMIESYMSYWQQLKPGLSLFNTRLQASNTTALSTKRTEYQIQLGTLKQTIAEIWIEIALRVQSDSALQNQITDTISVLLFPTVPDDACLTATVGILRKRFRWLYIPILNMDDGTNLVPTNRLKYLLGSSLRGSSTIFQERITDGAVKFVEEKPWEELEKMDLSGPGFISIDASKCQTLSHIEHRLVMSLRRKSKSRRESRAEEEEATADEKEAGGERGFEQQNMGGDWLVAQEQQNVLQTQQAEQARVQQQQQQQISSEIGGEQDSSRIKKRKALGLSPSSIEPSLPSSTTGPTLRSARSTRKKSSAAAPVIPAPTTSASTRAKKR
ncbi:hypothetical protein PSHT_11408 [Puccinia striiformis]|uniref:Uncharacterized protein n=1 Tax=Puccinia striiformis TaxID=27350 RepID=A0A2S4V3S0_9BASI|nr:hypothetical protein PSHT_11408 [Puccinia striiformis]